MRDMNHLYFAITVCAMTHFDVQCDVTALRHFLRVERLIHKRDMTHSHVRHDPFICVTHSYV